MMNDAPDEEPGQDDLAAPASLQLLLGMCARYMPQEDLALIRAAYQLAAEAHKGVCRKSGEPFIEHPLAVSCILAELAMDAHGLAAALLHDTVEDTAVTIELVGERFGPQIAAIVDGVTKFDAVELLDEAAEGDTPPSLASLDPARLRDLKARSKAETVRKLVMAMMRDPRVVLLKLADRLHNMRTLDSMAPAKRELIARETLEIYVPLAGRIGLYVFKSELEDLAFSYLYPAAYAHTAQRLRDEAMKRHVWAQRMCERMSKELAASNIPAAVNWRVKHTYRAYVEAQESGMDIAHLHDVIAFRVLVTKLDECYQSLGIIHHLWHPYGERIRDYIAGPKINGYQSLHTAVFALDGRLAQIHIRTHKMHRASQHGVAAYWLERAEMGIQAAPESLPWREHLPSWISQLATWQQELKLSAREFVETLRGEVFEDQVFISTPKGEVRELPAGSTVLDLAYQIHTGIGDHAIGAHVQTTGENGALVVHDVPLAYVLRTGDVVRVLTDPQAHPQAEWLSIAANRPTRERITRALRRRAEGASADAHGAEATAESALGVPGPLRHPSGKPALVLLARCCCPCPGDKIVGLAERGRTVSVHRSCCRTLRKTSARRREQGMPHAEPMRATWEEIQPIGYSLRLAIYGQDHRGLMYEVSKCIADLGLNLEHSFASANQERYKAA
ncbi:MAG TPA: HD domain-containing protein, partial [Ktedonobacterales bacterium]